MSRSGYTDDCEDQWGLIRWRGAVNSAIKGRRGQAFLCEALGALDAMPVKELIGESLVTADGEFCTLGVVGAARGMDIAAIDPDDRVAVAKSFGISEALAAEIMYENDECAVSNWLYLDIEICGPMRSGYPDRGSHKRSVMVANPRVAEERWIGMRRWITSQIKPHATPSFVASERGST